MGPSPFLWTGRVLLLEKNRCLYVGKGKSRGRLKHYERTFYLKEADLLEVYDVQSTSLLPRVECLAVHLFDPRDNRAKPARRK